MANVKKGSSEKSTLAHTMNYQKEVPIYKEYDELKIQIGTEERQILDDKSTEFNLKIIDFKDGERLRQVLTPDKNEIYILIISLITTVYISKFMGLDPLHPAALVFAGIIAFTSYCLRWGYAGVGHYAARLKYIEKEVARTGKPIVDFKVFGFLISFLLMITGSAIMYSQ